MAAHQMTGAKSKTGRGYPVVSLPNGANIRDIKNNLQWIESFESVVFAFDMDEKGQALAKEASLLLPPGKSKIAKFELKDASDMLKAGKVDAFVQAIWNAKDVKPDGLIASSDTWDLWLDGFKEVKAVPYPPVFGLDTVRGMAKGTMDVIGSFTKAGKSTMLRQLALHLFKETDDNIGYFALEEQLHETVTDLVGLHIGKNISGQPEKLDRDEFRKGWEEVCASDRFIFENTFAGFSIDTLLSKIRYMYHANNVKYLFIDNLTALLRHCTESSSDENFVCSKITTALAAIAVELGLYICLVSHVRKEGGDGKSYQDGKVMRVDDLYGSGDIAKWAHNIIAISRNNAMTPNRTRYHVLASRRGQIGVSNDLMFDFDTGRMVEYKQIEIENRVL